MVNKINNGNANRAINGFKCLKINFNLPKLFRFHLFIENSPPTENETLCHILESGT